MKRSIKNVGLLSIALVLFAFEHTVVASENKKEDEQWWVVGSVDSKTFSELSEKSPELMEKVKKNELLLLYASLSDRWATAPLLQPANKENKKS